jgi:hypothetical protein
MLRARAHDTVVSNSLPSFVILRERRSLSGELGPERFAQLRWRSTHFGQTERCHLEGRPGIVFPMNRAQGEFDCSQVIPSASEERA